MIPFNPVNRNLLIREPIKVLPVNPIAKRSDDNDNTAFDRRKPFDRRLKPFRHRGQFEMRKGRDRRNDTHINEQI